MSFGCQSMVKPIKRMLLKHPRDAFVSAAKISAQWKELNYLGAPDLAKALDEYEFFVSRLAETIPELIFLPPHAQTGLDSLYVHDPVIVTERGAILCNMGKPQRQGEPVGIGEFLPQIGVPIVGRISGAATLEGGDVVWIDARTLAVGRGYRTNAEGIRQLRDLAAEFVDEIISVQLPHWRGPADVLHLMSFLSPIDHDLSLVYSRLMPVPFREWLLARGIKLVEVPDEEFESMACNVLAVAPRHCIMLDGNPRTRKLLEAEGVEVRVFRGDEICAKGAGGPTCLTRPILRE